MDSDPVPGRRPRYAAAISRRHRLRRKARPVLLFLGVLTVAAVAFLAGELSGVPVTHTSSTEPVPIGIPGNWSLVFDDEFNGTSVNTNNWNENWFSTPGEPGKPDNSEKASCTSPGEVSEQGGDLLLGAAAESCDGYPYAGGLVDSDGKYSFTYGAFEARIYLPGSGGTVFNWPAFWTDGQQWPEDGEIDVMEGLQGVTTCHFHYSGGGPSGGCPNVGPGWHTFAANWEPGEIAYYYDGQEVGEVTTGVTSDPMYLVLENSVAAVSATTSVPATVEVDYVRVWQPAGSVTTTTTTTTTVPTSGAPPPPPGVVSAACSVGWWDWARCSATRSRHLPARPGHHGGGGLTSVGLGANQSP